MSNRRAKLPLNQAAAQAANQSVGGRKLSMSASDYPDRVKWMDAYVAAGGEVEISDSKSPVKSLKPPCKKEPCPPSDFKIEAPWRILFFDGGEVDISATELPGSPGGNYTWTTSSPNISLINPSSSTVTVVANSTPSASRDAEIITVTRSFPDCPPVTKTVAVTVAKVTFSSSPNQRYGYDDSDTPANTWDDHICVKRLDYTLLKVVIEGGLLGTDFDFVCDDPTICAPVPPGAVTSFDLRLDTDTGFIGPRRTKEDTVLRAIVKCPSAASFAQIDVHVYEEKKVDVVVAKIYDSTKAGTNLRFPAEDYSAFQNTANNKLKEAVVKFNISNFAANSITDVRYDLDGNGALTYDIAQGGGSELNAINRAMTGTGTKTRVAIVRSMKSYYYLSAAAAVGDRTVTVTAGKIFYKNGDNVTLGSGASQEIITVASSSGSTLTLVSPLTKAHARGDSMEFRAAGWSSDPIVIIEGNAGLNTIKWTIPHEAGHRNLLLKDVQDATSVMHFQQSWTDYRLRYCPRNRKYEPYGTENQWDTIPR